MNQNTDTRKVIVTGATGFVGSHTAKIFKENRRSDSPPQSVIGIDRELTIPNSTQYLDTFVKGDYVDHVAECAMDNNVNVIVHCAGTSLVGPSIADPGEYYNNNSAKTNLMLESLAQAGWDGTIIFSSSAAVYGIPKDNQSLTETDIKNPISPYGRSKLICEQIIEDHCRAYAFKGIALRYFNAAGCDIDGTLGHTNDDTHMIPRILSAYQKKEAFTLYGDDYNTHDGTCIRDYLHVEDIAFAHLDAMFLADSWKFWRGRFQAYNLGTGYGNSNKEVIDACEKVVKDKIEYIVTPRRIGDPDKLIANSKNFRDDTDWSPMRSSLSHIVETAWQWQQKLV
jgi:UDP-glucose 4-epimerase